MTGLMVRINDAGRKAAGFKPGADCVTRAIAIASQRPYVEVRAELALINLATRKTKRRVKSAGKQTAGEGIYTTTPMFKRYMRDQGFVWTPTMGIGTGCTVHLAPGELPLGRLVVSVSRHYTAVVDGCVWDTFDPCRGGRRCVYGYWRKP